MKKQHRNKNCITCGVLFIERTKLQLSCSKECAKKYADGNRNSKIGTSNTGAVGELKTCANLIENGFEVYRSQSRTSSADLIIWKNGISKRIEVRTGKYNLSGNFQCDTTRFRSDILAIVLKDQIIYVNDEYILKSKQKQTFHRDFIEKSIKFLNQ